MRKYNRRILQALVIAYKRGVINRKPLNKWLKFNEVFYRSMKYVSYLILFAFLFIILDHQLFSYFNLDETVKIGGYLVQKSRIISGILIGVIAFNLYRLGKYVMQIHTVRKTLKNYKVSNGDVEKLDNVTFKIHM